MRVRPPEGVAATVADPLARGVVRAVLEAADPERLVAEALASAGRRAAPGPPTALFALGKAAAAMARGAVGALGLPLDTPPGEPRIGGFRAVLARPASSPPLEAGTGDGGAWEEWPGGHPLPDVDSMGAGHGLLRLLRSLGPDDHLLALVSGGGSACCEVPAGVLSIADLVETQRALLASGLPIGRVNAVRKHLSQIKGGLALRRTAARVTVLVLSDVPGDDPAVVASGPFAADPSTFGDALAAVDSVGRAAAEGPAPAFPAATLRHLERGVAGEEEETLKPGETATGRASHRLLAGPGTAGGAVARWLGERGYRVERGELSGEAAEAGRRLVRRGRSLAPAAGPVAVVLHGETVVRLGADAAAGAPGGRPRGGATPGTGGRNQELALAAAAELAQREGSGGGEERVLAFASDGADGPTPAAGAWVDASTWSRLEALGADPAAALRHHRSHLALARLDDCLLRTGATGTNVADVVVYLRG